MPLSNLSFTAKKIIFTRLTCFFWLLAKGISWKVWLAGRVFPLIPPFDFLSVPSVIHPLLFIFSIICLCAILIYPANKTLLFIIIISELLSCLFDQNRWQSWEYEYLFITLALFLNNRKEEDALASIAFIFSSVYFFSGLGKINPGFSGYLQHELISTGIFKVSGSYSYNLLLYHFGDLLGIIEVLLGIGLIFKITSKPAAILLILMHLSILAILGSFGINYDMIIWPWNIFMILDLYLCFIRNNPVTISAQFFKNRWNKIFIIFFGLLPFLNFFGYWDYFLSSSLFSYKPPDMYICISDKGTAKALESFVSKKQNNFFCDSNSMLLNVQAWSMKEMNVPAYPEIRVYKKIKEQLLIRYPGMKASFIVYQYIDGKKRRIELK